MSQRHDMYSNVHKGLRHALCALLAQAGTTGATREELDALVSGWQDMQLLLSAHQHHEDLFIGPHLRTLAPAVFARMEREHTLLHDELAQLAGSARFLMSDDRELELRARTFYRQLAGFIGRYFAHMAEEESVYIEALQARYSDGELAAIESALVASIEPGLMAAFCRAMFPALTADECFLMLDDVRQNAPPPVFVELRQLAEHVVDQSIWHGVQRKLSGSSPTAPALPLPVMLEG